MGVGARGTGAEAEPCVGRGASEASGGRGPMGLAGSDSGTVRQRAAWFSFYAEVTPRGGCEETGRTESKAWRPRGAVAGGPWGAGATRTRAGRAGGGTGQIYVGPRSRRVEEKQEVAQNDSFFFPLTRN